MMMLSPFDMVDQQRQLQTRMLLQQQLQNRNLLQQQAQQQQSLQQQVRTKFSKGCLNRLKLKVTEFITLTH